ncbi:MAG: D-alanine--D-alanine ligase [Myxococcota bacterium]
MRIAIVCGGLGAERDVSFRTADAILHVLRAFDHDALLLLADRDIDRALRKAAPDAAFVALHGRSGEDGSVQGLLEAMAIPYTGPGVLACALAGSKPSAKAVLRQHNLPVAPHYVVGPEGLANLARRHGAFGLPVVVKPATGGLSLGVSIVQDIADLEAACAEALRLADAALVERRVGGREVVIALLDGRPLGAIDVSPSRGGLWDFRAKFGGGARATDHRPARLGAERMAGLHRLAERAAVALDLVGPALVGLIAGDEDIVVGANPLPPLWPGSPFARIAADAGLAFDHLVARLVGAARLRSCASRGERRVHREIFAGDERRAGTDPH